MKDIKNNVGVVKTINPAAYNTAQTGASADLSGYDAAMAVMHCGAITDGTHTPKLQESDDNSTFTDVAAADLDGSFAAMTANTIQRVGYVGAKRYIRVYVTSSGTTGAVYGAVIVLGKPAQAPTA